ncbi:hypothetical protein O6H91_01G173600 [Diphasiastrum complanatum]|uniref:Uncharacterized protein n=2 Tax=Diphasiastrum complanatum TaxID=34168 RepID=A0ACC2EYY4_DIPCM|nr:hypothetical protein O6H91_17G011800 [Diphasiastrum complanatum]KAJ7571698.1 hypothetical protein O6H91_01G173600 [Diphasiastrum complanatum]
MCGRDVQESKTMADSVDFVILDFLTKLMAHDPSGIFHCGHISLRQITQCVSIEGIELFGLAHMAVASGIFRLPQHKNCLHHVMSIVTDFCWHWLSSDCVTDRPFPGIKSHEEKPHFLQSGRVDA